MRTCSTVTFCKLRACPSSEALLRHQDATLTPEARRVIAAHLSSCDFCAAELRLLSKFSPEGEPAFQPALMPRHVYRLAKDLLALSTGDTTRTVEAIYETLNLTLTDA
jgi:hypothetical protein